MGEALGEEGNKTVSAHLEMRSFATIQQPAGKNRLLSRWRAREFGKPFCHSAGRGVGAISITRSGRKKNKLTRQRKTSRVKTVRVNQNWKQGARMKNGGLLNSMLEE